MRQRAHPPAAPASVFLLVVALSALLGACGNVTQSPAPTAQPTTGSSSVPGDATNVRVYFGLGSTSGSPILAPVERSAPGAADTVAKARAAIEALVAGPNQAELGGSAAMFTAVPSDAAFQGVQLDASGVATANFGEAFLGEDNLPNLRTSLAQVIVTLTQFPEVTGVQVTIDGAVMEQTDAQGQQLDRPATRADYADALGPIFVDDPAWGATLRSPFRLAGLADVFEASFRFKLLDAGGRSLADGQVMASCGSGCLGTYGVEVPFNVTTSTAGRLQVFDPSEVDGSPENVVDYPVTLLP